MNSNIKQLINPQNIGGYPYYGSDFVNLQERLKDLGSSYYDYLVNLTGDYEQYDAGGNVAKSVKAGVFLTYPTLTVPGGDFQNSTNTTVSPFIYYVDGELIYYPGGVLDLSFSQVNGFGNVIAFSRNTGTKEARTFKDGVSRDATVKYEAVLTEGLTHSGTTGSYNFPAGFDYSKQYVFIGFAGSGYNNRDLRYCLGLPGIENDIRILQQANNIGGWVQITNFFGAYNTGEVYYRVEGTTSARNRIVRFRGYIEIEQSAGSENLFDLPFSVDPPYEAIYLNGVYRSGSNTGTGHTRIRFSTGNTVYSERLTTEAQNETVGIYFDGITYALD